MNGSLNLAARLSLDAQQWQRGIAGAQGRMSGFVGSVRREVSALNGFLRSAQGTLASLGVGLAIGKTIADSAKTDQALSRIQQTAGMTTQQTALLRRELHGMAMETGNSFTGLHEGFGQLVAGGLAFEKSLPTIDAVNKSMRVTGSEATTLTGALLSAQEHFKFDLSQPGMALELLDKMTVAGREGVIEIEDLANVFGSAASEAKAAGLSFEQTLALFEGLGTATTKDRVGTLVASTMRVFTNQNYMREAQKATGIRFYDDKNEKRDPLAVIADIKKAYDKLKTDAARDDFIFKAFGKTDLDTVKGIRAAMSDGKLSQIQEITSKLSSASGTTARDMDGAMNNAVAQAAVLKETLAEAGDRFSAPITGAITKAIQYLTGSEEKGGIDLSGGQLIGAAAAATGGAYIGGRVLKGFLGRRLRGAGDLATGVAMGTALEKAGAATPVFVVGAAPGVFGSGGAVMDAATGTLLPKSARRIGGARVGALARMGVTGAGALAGGVTLAGGAGWMIGSGFNRAIEGTAYGDRVTNQIGTEISKLLALLGNREARQNLERMKLDVDVDVNDRLTRVTVRGAGANFGGVTGGSSAVGKRKSGGGR